MEYCLDIEFIENGIIIDPISIGIVSEDDREYYAINQDCNLRKASPWVKENVIAKLPPRYPTPIDQGGSPRLWGEAKAWASLWTIKQGIIDFIGEDEDPQIWANYGGFDFVVFSRIVSLSKPSSLWGNLFGREQYNPLVENYPKHFPYFFNDIQQLAKSLGSPELPKQTKGEHNALEDARWNKLALDFLRSLPSKG